MTTLEAVNEILEACGLQRVNTYTTGDASHGAQAERRLDRSCMDILSDGWQATTRKNQTLSPILYTFTNAAWTAATKTLTLTAAFGNATVGQTITITDANGGTEGDYVVSEVTSVDAVKLTTSLNATDIANGIDGEAATNQIKIPSSTLYVDAQDQSLDIVQLGDHLFDRSDQGDGSGGTDQFTDSIDVEITLRYDFECLPYKIQQYVVQDAALQFYDRVHITKNPMLYQRLVDRRREAKVRAEQYNGDQTDLNTLRAPHNRDFTGAGRFMSRDVNASFPASGLPG